MCPWGEVAQQCWQVLTQVLGGWEKEDAAALVRYDSFKTA